jgi:hypothetical protein
MTIAFAQVQNLFKSISTAVPDQMDCDGCCELSAQFAEAETSGAELSDLLKAVQIHLNQCPCCAYEYDALLEAVRAADLAD